MIVLQLCRSILFQVRGKLLNARLGNGIVVRRTDTFTLNQSQSSTTAF